MITGVNPHNKKARASDITRTGFCFRVSLSSGRFSLFVKPVRYFVVLTGSVVQRLCQTFRVVDAASPQHLLLVCNELETSLEGVARARASEPALPPFRFRRRGGLCRSRLPLRRRLRKSRLDGEEPRLRLLDRLHCGDGSSDLSLCRIPCQPRVTRERDAHVFLVDISSQRLDEAGFL